MVFFLLRIRGQGFVGTQTRVQGDCRGFRATAVSDTQTIPAKHLRERPLTFAHQETEDLEPLPAASVMG